MQTTPAANPGSDERAAEAPEALRKRMAELIEENHRLTDAIAARDAFLAVAAHELRNPIAPILGRLELLRQTIARGLDQPEIIEQKFVQIELLINRFLKRATTLLNVSRMTSGQIHLDIVEVDVCEVVQSVAENLRPIAKYAGAALELDMPVPDLKILADRLSLEQVLDNLVSNAIKYGDGKPILVSATADAANGVARISVRDGGPGISAENQARIFERFERAVKPGAHTGGFGVGLWIVQQLSVAMNGTVQVKSVPDEGSIFCVALPMPS